MVKLINVQGHKSHEEDVKNCVKVGKRLKEGKQWIVRYY